MSIQQEHKPVEFPDWFVRWHEMWDDKIAKETAEVAAAEVIAEKKEIAPSIAPEPAVVPVSVPHAPVVLKAPPKQTPPAIAKPSVPPAVGQKMEDGTIYAGKSPVTGKAMYAAPADAPAGMSFNKAAKYAKKLEIGGNKDFRVPAKEELKMLYKNRAKGAFKGTFKTEDEEKAGWYWTSNSSSLPFMASSRRFYSGLPFPTFKLSRTSVRCVR